MPHKLLTLCGWPVSQTDRRSRGCRVTPVRQALEGPRAVGAGTEIGASWLPLESLCRLNESRLCAAPKALLGFGG
jgi:hypothetical protein